RLRPAAGRPHPRWAGLPPRIGDPGDQLRHRAPASPWAAPASRPRRAASPMAPCVGGTGDLAVGTVPAGLPTRGQPAPAGSADRLDFRGFWGCPELRAAQAGGGVWRSLAARFVRDEEAAGSNPATPTQVAGPFSIMRGGPSSVHASPVRQGAATRTP